MLTPVKLARGSGLGNLGGWPVTAPKGNWTVTIRVIIIYSKV